jgi:hypothetical protein
MKDRLRRWLITLIPMVIARNEGARMIAPIQPDLAEAVGTLSCQAASCTSRGPPIVHITASLHIGSSHLWKSRATCDRDSTVPPWSPTDVPAPSGLPTCRIHPEHCYVQAASGSRSGL